MLRNVATKVTLHAYDAATGLAKTGDAANITMYVAKDGGTVTALTDTGAAERDATKDPGGYQCDVADTETDAATLVFSGKSTTANIVIMPLTFCPSVTVGAVATDAITAASINTGAFTADAFAADALVAATFATDAITDDAIATGAIASTAFAAGAINAAAIASDAIEAAKIKDGAITNAKVADDLDVNVKTITNDAITAASIANNAIDLATFAADVKTGSALKVNVETITNDAITAASINTGAFTADAFAADALVAATFATDAITDDAIATGAIASTAFAAGAISAAAIADGAIDAATFAAGAIDAAAIKDGAIDAATFAAGAITAAAIATDAIDADALKADAITEIQAGLATPTNITAASGVALSATQAAYAPAKAGDAMALTSGERTTLAGVIWALATSGMTTAGSIGKKLADWVVGTIDTYTGNTKQTGDAFALIGTTGSGLTSLATQTSVNDLPTNSELATALAAADDAVLAAVAALAIPTAADNADAVWGEDVSTYSDANSAGKTLTSVSAAKIADAVWNEPWEDHDDSSDKAGYVLVDARDKASTAAADAASSADISAEIKAGTTLVTIDEAALITNIVPKVWQAALPGTAPGTVYTSGQAGYILSEAGGTGLDATETAAAVWDAVAATYDTPNTMGARLNDAGGATDPLTKPVPGTYLTGTAGEALGAIAALSAGGVTVLSPMDSTTSNVTGLVKGASYTGPDVLLWIDTGDDWPTIAGAQIAITVEVETGGTANTIWAATATTSGSPAHKAVSLSLSTAQTSALVVRDSRVYEFKIWATTTDVAEPHAVTARTQLVTGTMTVTD